MSGSGRNRLRITRYRTFIAGEAGRRGAVCESCGDSYEPGVFHWHHRNPETKVFNISQGWSRSLEAVELELAKCDLLCPTCHQRKHRSHKSKVPVDEGTSRGLLQWVQ